jgi:hypothetical protein
MVRCKVGELVRLNSTWDDVPIYTNEADEYFTVADKALAIVLGPIGIIEHYSMYPVLLMNGKHGWCHSSYIERT